MSNNSEINVDEIMKEIRREVARRKKEHNYPPEHPSSRISERYPATDASRSCAAESSIISPGMKGTFLWKAFNGCNEFLCRSSLYNRLYIAVRDRFKGLFSLNRPAYDLNVLLAGQDEEFAVQAYGVLLGREPDYEGMNSYVTRLRNGSISKIDILASIRYSKEGKERGIRVKGLRRRFLWNKLLRVPIAGFVVRYVLIVISLPRVITRMEKLDAKGEANYFELKKLITITMSEHEFRNKQDISNITREVQDHKYTILDQQRRLGVFLDEISKARPETLSPEEMSLFINERDHLLDAMYLTFEDRFRGSREDIKERLKAYIPYVCEAAKGRRGPLLDIGCGRGEWLELLSENGITAKGIDLNKIMVRQCLDRGFEVQESDALEYLKKQDPNSLGVITGFHVVEHLPMRTLISLFDESLRALMPGGMVIFETPNPENIIVGSCNFYYDPTHIRPIPPDVLQFLAETRGFIKTEILRLHPLNFINVSNTQIDKIIERFNKELDYSVIGYKA